jgi:hypothetical protein
MCVYVVLCGGGGLAHTPPKESYRLCIDQETEKVAKDQRAVEPQSN